jgi:type IV pilus assembly protein PilB
VTPEIGTADKRLVQLLFRRGQIDAAAATETVSDVDIARAIAAELKIPLVDFASSPPSADAAERIDEKTARSLASVPLRVDDGILLVVMAKPLDYEAVHRLEFSTGLGIRTAVAPFEQILETLERLYKRGSSFNALFPEGEPSDPQLVPNTGDEIGPLDVRAVAREAAQPPIVKLVNMILREGFDSHASDIHIEPRPTTLTVRNRIDGILVEALQVPKWVHASMVARIKIMAKLDITERRRPQDGHFAVRFADVARPRVVHADGLRRKDRAAAVEPNAAVGPLD